MSFSGRRRKVRRPPARSPTHTWDLPVDQGMEDDRHFPPPPPSPALSLGLGNWLLFPHAQTGEEDYGWHQYGADDVAGKVKQALVYAALMELESRRAADQEQIQRLECEIARLRDLLGAATRELDQAQEQALQAREQARQALIFLDKGQFLLHDGGGAPTATTTPRSPPNHIGPAATGCSLLQVVALDAPDDANHVAPSSGGSGAMVSPSSTSSSLYTSEERERERENSRYPSPAAVIVPPAVEVELIELVPARKLPEKGRLLEAVMKAGPLLQNLMLAGPLPQWRHPPPPLRSFEIPPVSIGNTNINAAATTISPLSSSTTTMTTTEDAKPICFGAPHSPSHLHGLRKSSGKRSGGDEDEDEGEAAAAAAAAGQYCSPPSSASSSPKIYHQQ